MQKLKAFKFQLKANAAEALQLRRFSGCCRFVWNKALAMQRERLDNKQSCLSYPKIAGELIQWKRAPEAAWLSDVHSQPLQQTLKNIDRTIYDKKNPKRFPRFKKKGQGGTHCPESGSIIGLDRGITKFATLLDGTVFQPVNSYRKHQKKLKKTQRQLSAKGKFSNNGKKQKAKMQQLHSKIANIRGDSLHKTSIIISKNHAAIAIEDLQVSNMSASAKGTAENHGKNIKEAKAGLNKSIPQPRLV